MSGWWWIPIFAATSIPFVWVAFCFWRVRDVPDVEDPERLR